MIIAVIKMPNNGLEKDLEYLKLEFLTYQNLKKK